jgi:RNA polymerase sigma-70 factor (ECF subfamily)
MAELVRRYETPLYRFILSMVGDAGLAEDLFQETFLRFHRYRGSYDSSHTFKPYLYKIASNLARETRSARGRAVRRVSLSDDSTGLPLAEQLPSSAPDPREAGETGELQRNIRSALGTLPDAEREVVHLRMYEEMTFPQIALVTGVPVATAQSRMVYAIRRLRRALKVCVQGRGA